MTEFCAGEWRRPGPICRASWWSHSSLLQTAPQLHRPSPLGMCPGSFTSPWGRRTRDQLYIKHILSVKCLISKAEAGFSFPKWCENSLQWKTYTLDLKEEPRGEKWGGRRKWLQRRAILRTWVCRHSYLQNFQTTQDCSSAAATHLLEPSSPSSSRTYDTTITVLSPLKLWKHAQKKNPEAHPHWMQLTTTWNISTIKSIFLTGIKTFLGGWSSSLEFSLSASKLQRYFGGVQFFPGPASNSEAPHSLCIRAHSGFSDLCTWCLFWEGGWFSRQSYRSLLSAFLAHSTHTYFKAFVRLYFNSEFTSASPTRPWVPWGHIF